MKQLLREAEITSCAQCDYVVKFYGISIDTSPYSLIMEYIDNGDLYHHINSHEEMTWGKRLQIAKDIIYGLNFLHNQKKPIFHRDLKSLNILLDSQMRAKLSDFGSSKIKRETKDKTTNSLNSEQLEGTWSHMAPELFGRKAKFTEKCDIYSYSIILWELAAREQPFKDVENAYIIPALVKQGERDDIPIDCPPKFAKLIKECWVGNANDRPAANEVKDTLEQITPEDLVTP